MIDGDKNLLINFIKLLLCISSLSSIKDKHLTKVGFLEAETQNEYFSSVEFYLQIDNNNEKQNTSFDLNNFDNLNLSESLMNDLKDLKNNLANTKNEKAEEKKLTLGSSIFEINNKINFDDNPYENKNVDEPHYFGKITENNKNEEKKPENINNNIDIDTIKKDLLNNNNLENLQPINVEKNVYINPTKETIDNLNLNTLDKIIENNPDNQQKVIVEKKTYCSFIKVGKDGKPIDINNDKNLSPINEISLFLSGGDFLHKKIDILEETLLKNSEMYNFVIDKYEKDSKILKEEIENLKNQHKSEIEKLTKELENYKSQINDLSSLKNDNQTEIEKIKKELDNEKTKYNELLIIKNQLEKDNDQNININKILNDKKDNEIVELKKNIDELKTQLNKKDIENYELKKLVEELKSQKEKELLDFQKQIKDITSLKDQEISMLNNKIKNDQINQNDKALLLEKDFEQYKINSNKMNNELMNQNNELKKQISEIPLLRQEKEKYKNLYETIDNENVKMHSEMMNIQDRFEMGKKAHDDLKHKIADLERKLNSDPYFAKEIMSKTLYSFATRIMMENN